jgi:hypothetical protein
MLKCLGVLAVLLAVIQAPLPIPGKASDNPARAGGTVDHPRENQGSTAPPLAPVAHTASSERNQQQTKPELADPYDPRHDYLYRAYLWFTIGGVVVGLIGIVAIYAQTRATARSARASEDSVKLQEIGLKQWLKLENWQTATFEDSPRDLWVFFHVVNPTGRPLVFQTAFAEIGSSGRQPIAALGVLAPDNPFVASVMVPLKDEEFDRFQGRQGLGLTAKCYVLFADCCGDKWQQDFERTLVCRQHMAPGVSDLKNTLHEAPST